jgi:hypothetical protein
VHVDHQQVDADAQHHDDCEDENDQQKGIHFKIKNIINQKNLKVSLATILQHSIQNILYHQYSLVNLRSFLFVTSLRLENFVTNVR